MAIVIPNLEKTFPVCLLKGHIKDFSNSKTNGANRWIPLSALFPGMLLLCEIPKSFIISIRKLFRSSSSKGD